LISEAVRDMAILRYFPADEGARLSIMRLLLRIVPFGAADQLGWLTQTLIDRVGEWYGPVEIRAVFCTRYAPADGIEADCVHSPGFRAEEMETKAKAPLLDAGEQRERLKQLDIPPDSNKLVH
jgi:hypothetical protein